MNEIQNLQTQKYSLEAITRLRIQKKKELKESKEHILELTQELFAPQQSKNRVENLMQHVNAGIAAYDGLRTGLMVLKRIRSFFHRKKKK